MGKQVAVARTLCAFLAVLSSSNLLAELSLPVEKPTLSVSDQWQWVTFDGLTRLQVGSRTEKVSAVDPGGAVTSVRAGANEQAGHLDDSANSVNEVHGQIETERRFVFPLAAGSTWSSRWNWINGRGHGGRLDMTYKVTGIERIKVTAGEFDTVVIEGRGTWANSSTGDSGIAMEKTWYAPAAKRHVKRTWLTKFNTGQGDQNFVIEASEVNVK